MGAITDLSDLVNRASGGGTGNPETVFFFKAGRAAGVAATATVAGRPASLWTYDGTIWGPGTTPGAVAAPTKATNGALPFTNASGGREKKLIQAFQCGLNGGMLLIYDRLLHIGGLSGTTTTAQTVGGTLTRNTGGVGNQIWVEIYTIIGTTATTITASYTNQAGTSGRTTTATAFGGSNNREVTRMINLPLQAGDTGVQSVQSVTVLATTGTAGNFGVTVVKPIVWLPAPIAGAAASRDFAIGLPNIPTIDTDACLAPLWIPQGTSVPEIFGGIATIEA